MRDTKALEHFLKQMALTTLDLQRQAFLLLRSNFQGDLATIDREVVKARRFTASIDGQLESAEREIFRLGGKDAAR